MASLHLHALFTDHAVLQRDQPLPVWGTATAGESITATLAGQQCTAEADAAGSFRVVFAPVPAGGPHELTVSGPLSGTLTIRDLLVGEVWLCSGQSNMDYACNRSGFTPEELAERFPRLRLFKVPYFTAETPQRELHGEWSAADATTLATFSGCGFAFGRALLRQLDVPLGLIHCAWSGTAAESWTSLPTLESNPLTKPIVDAWRQPLNGVTRDSPAGRALQTAWEAKAYHQDPGISAAAAEWMAPQLDTSTWRTMDLPRTWESTGLDIDGAVWFRRTCTVPAELAGSDLVLRLGAIDDFDTTWFNGVKIGGIGKETANAHAMPRVYRIPIALVRAGDNVIAVRVFDHFGQGGICTGPLRLETTGRELVADLHGDWSFRIELELAPKRNLPPPPFRAPNHCPSFLYNAMIAPLAPYALQGVIWYQGEANTGRAEQYRTLLPAMIADWRALWQRDFPFLIVQLNAFRPRQAAPADRVWAELRAAQSAVARAVPHVWRCVCVDLGEPDDIHPRNKAVIGWRLALLARHHVYGDRTLPADSPTYVAHTIAGPAIRLRFANAEGLTAPGGHPLSGFAIAGADRTWHWAQAKVDGDSVIVSHPAVPAPVAARYAWSDFPDARLINAAGLPLDSFRTDDWPLSTAGVLA